MGSVPSHLKPGGELKVYPNLAASKISGTNNSSSNEFDLERQTTNPKILVSITKDNTVRISEGKSIATQTGEESKENVLEVKHTLEPVKPENGDNKSEKQVPSKKQERSVQTELSLFEAKIQNESNDAEKSTMSEEGLPDNKFGISNLPRKTPEIVKSVNFHDTVIKHESRMETSRSLFFESENEGGETDYWTDIGIQTDDDFDEYFGPRQAWGSKSVDSAKTLLENDGESVEKGENEQDSKEANDDEEKEMDTRNVESPLEVGSFENLTFQKYGKYKVRLSSDKERCIVSSAAFLDTGDAVVIDRSNLKIKFVDRKFQFISSHELPAKPWGVCARGVDVYVTMGNTKIQHFVVGQDMIIEAVEVFEIKGRCLGICIFEQNNVVGLQIGELCLLNFKGEKTGTIQLPKINGKTCNPWHLYVTSEHNLLVTDSDAGAIYCVSRKSELIFTFTGIGSPRGTALDLEGNIIVVGRDKESGSVVSMLHKDMELQSMLHIEEGINIESRVMMTWDQLEFVPYCVCFRPDRTVILGGIQEAIKIMKLR